MKIRKLIISAKLEQIENKNQNIFIFHCSANANQWRYLKNFFYKKTTEKLQDSQKLYLQSPQVVNRQLEEPLRLRQSYVRAYTFFKSTGLKKKLSVAQGLSQSRTHETAESSGTFVNGRLLARPKAKRNRLIETNLASKRPSGTKILSSSTKSSYNKSKPKGCLFFFDAIETNLASKPTQYHQKNNQCFELINKIESLEFNKNLILLYGRLNSTTVNHVDVKEALNLETKATYQQFFTSMHSASLGLSFCLDQQISQFFGVQESRNELPLSEKH
jgi:hypothetical protein